MTRIGGSFAPPLTDELLTKYANLVKEMPQSPQQDAMAQLLHCCGVWWELPESKIEGTPHSSGRGLIVPLEDEHKKTLWEHIPWTHELESMKLLFENISNLTHKELRDAAHHLLWHVIELDLDREPITTDKL